jgi:hypothetical protein
MAETIQLLAKTDPIYVNELIKNGVTKQVVDKIMYLVIEDIE